MKLRETIYLHLHKKYSLFKQMFWKIQIFVPFFVMMDLFKSQAAINHFNIQ